jgi:hypothetical protein
VQPYQNRNWKTLTRPPKTVSIMPGPAGAGPAGRTRHPRRTSPRTRKDAEDQPSSGRVGQVTELPLAQKIQILFLDDLDDLDDLDGSEAARSGSKADYDETPTAGKVMHKKLISIAALALMISGSAAVAATATPASATVLINYPGTSVKVGHTFKVGDWYQQASGGSRWYSTSVYSPSGSRVLHKTGYAPSSSWKFWNIKATRTGNYKVRYDIGQGNGHYRSFWYTVRSHH